MAKSYDGTITLSTLVDTGGINKGISSIKSSLKGIAGAIGVAFSVTALVNFGKEAVNLASDLQEVQNVVDVAFGDMSYKIEKFAKTSIDAFGMSELTAKRTASTYMSMAKGMGIAEETASDMAIQMTALSADLASFYNMSQERADVILKSVYTGETESLKQLGIVMTEVNLQQFAQEKGIKKSLSAMNQQEKTMLRYQYVLEQTALASGDFARTQDSFANKTRVLTERWKQMQTIFGETMIILLDSLLPALEWAVNKLTVMMLYFSALVRGLTGKTAEEGTMFAEKIQEVGDSTDSANKPIENMTENLEDMGDAAGKAYKQLAGFDDLMILSSGGAGSDFGTSFEDFDVEGFEGLTSGFQGIKSALDEETMKNIEEFEQFISDNSPFIKETAAAVGLGTAFGWLGAKIIPNLLGWFKKKDSSLDTQTGKTLGERVAVGALSTAFGLLGAGIPVLVGKSKKWIDQLKGELIPQTQTAKENVTGLADSTSKVTANTTQGKIPLDNYTASVGLLGEKSDKAAEGLDNVASYTYEVGEESYKAHAYTSLFNETLGVTQALAEAVSPVIDTLTGSYRGMNDELERTLDLMGKEIPTGEKKAAQYSDVFNNAFNPLSSPLLQNKKTNSGNINVATDGLTFDEVQQIEQIMIEKGYLSPSGESSKGFIGSFFESGTEDALSKTVETMGQMGENALPKLEKAGEYAVYVFQEVLKMLAGAAVNLPKSVFAAKGGIIPRATRVIAGEAGTEAILPLENNTQWMDILADKLSMRGGGGRNQTIILELDGRELGRAVANVSGSESRRAGITLVHGGAGGK